MTLPAVFVLEPGGVGVGRRGGIVWPVNACMAVAGIVVGVISGTAVISAVSAAARILRRIRFVIIISAG